MNSLQTHQVRTLLLFAMAAAILAGACLLHAGDIRTVATVVPLSGGEKDADASAVPARTPFTRDQVLDSIAQSLVSHFNLEGDLQIDLLRAWAPPARLASAWEMQVIEFPTVVASSMILRCRVIADHAPVADATLVVRAQLWRDAWSTRQPLTMGATFDPSLLEARKIDLLRERDALPAAVGDRSYVFSRAVQPGRLLTWRDIARRPLVKKGDLVEVSASEGALIVTMKALAMENGAQGDTVTVRNPESRKDFAAMVIDENRVQVRF